VTHDLSEACLQCLLLWRVLLHCLFGSFCWHYQQAPVYSVPMWNMEFFTLFLEVLWSDWLILVPSAWTHYLLLINFTWYKSSVSSASLLHC
jgi:hypothetical protein